MNSRHVGCCDRNCLVCRGKTLVIAPKTLLKQWEAIEIKKFLGPQYM